MRIAFIGCVEIGLECLRQVLRDGWEVSAVFTLAKKYAGKTSGFVDFTPLAKRRRIPIYKVRGVNDAVNAARIKRIDPDLIIICGWQRLVSEEILKIPPKGVVGFHSSLLPRYRGRAPVNWAIIMGEKRTGVTMFYCEPEADTGDIIAQRSFPIKMNDTCAMVYTKSARAARGLLHKYLPRIADGTVARKKNTSRNHKFWPKRTPEDGRIDWTKDALEIHNWIRALTRPYPGAFTYYKGKRLFVWSSSYNRNAKRRPSSMGKILNVSHKGVLVGTGDRPIWLSDITLNGRAFNCRSLRKNGTLS